MRFFFDNPTILILQALHEDVFIYLSNEGYELHYNFQPEGELRYPKEYFSALLRNETPQIMEAISTRLIRKLTVMIER